MSHNNFIKCLKYSQQNFETGTFILLLFHNVNKMLRTIFHSEENLSHIRSSALFAESELMSTYPAKIDPPDRCDLSRIWSAWMVHRWGLEWPSSKIQLKCAAVSWNTFMYWHWKLDIACQEFRGVDLLDQQVLVSCSSTQFLHTEIIRLSVVGRSREFVRIGTCCHLHWSKASQTCAVGDFWGVGRPCRNREGFTF